MTFTNFWHFKMFYLEKKRATAEFAAEYAYLLFTREHATYWNCIALFVIAGMVRLCSIKTPQK